MSGHPIFLVIDGAASGPHEVEEVLQMLDDEEIAPETFGCIEGMKEWRGVRETLVWSWAALLSPVREQALALVERMAAGKSSAADTRAALRPLLGPSLLPEIYPALSAVLEVNAQLRQGFVQFQQGTQDGVTDVFPAAELFCAHDKFDFPRDWHAAWQSAGGQLHEGRMVARKDAPVWLALSDFGHPFPPFSFDRSMWTRDVERNEAERLGLLNAQDIISVNKVEMPGGLVGVDAC